MEKKHGEPCDKCLTPMVMHYTVSCPKCDKPEDVTIRILDYFKVSRYIQTNEGYDKDWYHDVLDAMDIKGNDTGEHFWIETSEEAYGPLHVQMSLGLIKYFDFKPGDKLMFWISW